MGLFERCFFYLYPTNMKVLHPENAEAHWLRCNLLIATIVHSGLAFFCLALVGFWPMVINLLQACVVYSCYLTMREREIVVYLILIVIQMVTDFFSLFKEDKDTNSKGSLKFLGVMVLVCTCAILGYMVGKAYYEFRKIGGLHMKYKYLDENQRPLLYEEKIAGQAMDYAN